MIVRGRDGTHLEVNMAKREMAHAVHFEIQRPQRRKRETHSRPGVGLHPGAGKGFPSDPTREPILNDIGEARHCIIAGEMPVRLRSSVARFLLVKLLLLALLLSLRRKEIAWDIVGGVMVEERASEPSAAGGSSLRI